MNLHHPRPDQPSPRTESAWPLRLPRWLTALAAARASRVAAWQRQKSRGWSAPASDPHGKRHHLEPMEGRVHLSAPIFETALANQYMTIERALTIGVNGGDPDGDALSIDVQTDNPGLVAVVPDGNRFARMRFVDVDDQGVRTHIGDIVVEIFETRGSTAAERFITLATNEVLANGTLNPDGTPYYTDVVVHRVIPGFVIQTGDAENGTGTGGSPLGDFDDEFDDTLAFAGAGVLAMANSGPDTNDSQWFITAGPTPNLDPFDSDSSRHMIFGQMVEGQSVYNSIINRPRNSADRPNDPPLLESVEIFESTEDFTVTLIPQEGFTGGTVTVDVTLTDTNGESVTQEILVDVVGLGPKRNFTATPGTATQINNVGRGGGAGRIIDLTATASLSGATVTASDANNRLTITPPAAFSGYFELTVTAKPQNLNLVPARQVFGVIAQAGSDPQLIGHIDTGGEAKAAIRDGNVLYLALGDGGLAAYDISTPATPQLLDTITTADGLVNIVQLGDTIFGLDDNKHLVAYDISDPAQLTLADSATIAANGRDMLVNGNLLYIAQGAEGVVVFNIADPTNFVQTETFKTVGALSLGTVVGIERKDSYFYVLAGNGDLHVLRQISGQLRPVPTVKLGGTARDMTLDQDHLYVADSLLGLKVIDVSTPNAPRQVGALQELLTNYNTVRVVNETVVVGHSSNRGYTLVDVSDPTRPSQEGKFQTPETGGIALVDGNRLHLPMGDSGLATLNTTRIAERSTDFKRATVTLPDGRRAIVHASTGGYFPVPSRVRVTTDDAGNIERINVIGATEATILRIIVPGRDPVDVGEVDIDGDLRVLVGRNIRITDKLTADGYIRALVVDELSGAITIDEGPSDRHAVTIVANRIENASIVSEAPINMLRVGEWVDSDTTEDSLSAPWMARMLVTGGRELSGDMQADVTLTEDSLRGQSLGAAVIRGDVAARTWKLDGGANLLLADNIADGFTLNSGGNVVRLITRGDAAGMFAAANFGVVAVLGDLNEANLLAGTNLGANATLGGSSTNADTFAAGGIGRLIVRGDMLNSIVSGGLRPGNTILGDTDDQRIADSRLGPLTVLGNVTNSRFVADQYPRLALLGAQRIDPLTDGDRFLLTDVFTPAT